MCALGTRGTSVICSSGCSGHLKRINPFDARRPLIAGTSSPRSGALCGRRARRPCRSVAGGSPRRGDAGWSPLPSNLDDGGVNNLSNGGYLNAPFRLSSLRRRDRNIRRRKWHRIHCSWNFAARAVWTVAISGTDGPSRAADPNLNGSIAFRGSNCFPTWRPELTSLASDVYWNYKCTTRRFTLDLKCASAHSFWVELSEARYSAAGLPARRIAGARRPIARRRRDADVIGPANGSIRTSAAPRIRRGSG